MAGVETSPAFSKCKISPDYKEDKKTVDFVKVLVSLFLQELWPQSTEEENQLTKSEISPTS